MLRVMLCYDLTRNLYVLVILYSMIICVGYLNICQKWAPDIFNFGVLVGAFSVFGYADTGKPVQIYVVFCDFEGILGV